MESSRATDEQSELARVVCVGLERALDELLERRALVDREREEHVQALGHRALVTSEE